MAQDIFLKIEGVNGESRDSAHKGEIDILAFSTGVSQSGTMHMGGGGGGGKASFQDLHVTKPVDKSSTELMLRCASGKHFPTAILTVRKAGDNPLEYMIVTMTDVLISSYSLGASGDSEKVTEQASLNFAKVKVEYKEQLQAGGAGAQPSMTWNIAENKAE
jgi:type VI secretion system secreted protein Hcp